MIAGSWQVDKTLSADAKELAQKRLQRCYVVMKMFLVMGITWIAETVSWSINESYGEYEVFKNNGLWYSELFFTIINSSQVNKTTVVTKKYCTFEVEFTEFTLPLLIVQHFFGLYCIFRCCSQIPLNIFRASLCFLWCISTPQESMSSRKSTVNTLVVQLLRPILVNCQVSIPTKLEWPVLLTAWK